MAPDLPSIKSFLFPILQLLVEASRPLDRQTIARGAADRLGLSEQQRAIRIPSGKAFTYRHRSGWALQELKHAGLVTRPGPNAWAATPAGCDFLAGHAGGFALKELGPLQESVWQVQDDEPVHDTNEAQQVAGDAGTPLETIFAALSALRSSLAAELTQRLHECDPIQFERIVLEVLHKNGYGASRESLHHTPATGDGGIDGIIALDSLGLEKVYVQAKRWQNAVGRPELQSFFGALSGRKARKGVFITTSDFTAGARDFASSVSDTLVLVNGAKLVELMIDSGVGVTHRSLKIPNLDADYFSEE